MEQPVVAGYTERELASILVIGVVVALVVFIQGAALLSALVGGLFGLIAAAVGIRFWSKN